MYYDTIYVNILDISPQLSYSYYNNITHSHQFSNTQFTNSIHTRYFLLKHSKIMPHKLTIFTPLN